MRTMFINYEDFIGVMEDFNDVLLDYDIACEGFIETAKNVVGKAIDTLLKLFRQAFQFIRSKLKKKPDKFNQMMEDHLKDLEDMEKRMEEDARRSKQMDDDIDRMTDDFVKKGGELEVNNWKLNYLADEFEKAFNKFDLNLLFSLMPEYNSALKSGEDEKVKSLKTKLEDNFDTFCNKLDEIQLKNFVNDPGKIKLSANSPEGLKQVKHFMTIGSVLQKVERVIDEREAKIMSQLQKFKQDVVKINGGADFSQGDANSKRNVMMLMNRIMSGTNKETNDSLRFLTGLVDKLTADFNKFTMTFFK